MVVLQRVHVVNNSTTVLDERELDRFTRSVAYNETVHQPYTVTPTMAGERLQLTFLLHDEIGPQELSIENAYRELHLWVNVTQSE